MTVFKKCLTALCAAMLLIGCLTLSAFAAESNVTYSGSAGQFIFAPGSDYSLTDLFPNFKDVMPGDSLTQTVSVRNDASHGVKVRIYMRSLGAVENAAFLDQLKLTVKKAGSTPMFDAAADKTDGLTDWTYLGTLYSGGEAELNVTLDVPIEMDNTFQKQVGKLKWEFKVEELPISPSDPVAPKTGDTARPALWLTMATSAVLLGGLLCICEKRRRNKTERVEG